METLSLQAAPLVPVVVPPSSTPSRALGTDDTFFPKEPATLEEVGLAPTEIEALVLKQLLVGGAATGRKIAEQIKLSFGLMQELVRGLKAQLLVSYKNQATMGDFEIALTEEGELRARWHVERCTYCGAAPVPLRDYIVSVQRQTVRRVRPLLGDLCTALEDLSLSPNTISQIGQAIQAGRGLFLYGQPGNGKTSIAERMIRAIDQTIWIPRTITVTGEIIRVFDPASHEEVPPAPSNQILDLLRIDRRWVRIKRPLIVVGGELKMEHLEVATNAITGILESPVQLKANGGVLVVDDFGRQRMSITELLNRWIVPLEKGNDYLTLPSGRQIQVPFDPLLVFSTNLEPHKLVDEAFLRRIPYKIEVVDPTPKEFRDLFQTWCQKLDIEHKDDAVEHLIQKHFVEAQRPMRYCLPRDLLLQVSTFCEFHELPRVLTTKALDVAVKNYFAGL